MCYLLTVRVFLSLHELDGLFGLVNGPGWDAPELEAGPVHLPGNKPLSAVVERLVLKAVADQTLGCKSSDCTCVCVCFNNISKVCVCVCVFCVQIIIYLLLFIYLFTMEIVKTVKVFGVGRPGVEHLVVSVNYLADVGACHIALLLLHNALFSLDVPYK